MIYLLSALAVVSFICLAWLSLYALFECGFLYKIAGAIFWIASLTAFFYVRDVQKNENPCVKYETRMHYNPATKTMMPLRICSERGEWVE